MHGLAMGIPITFSLFFFLSFLDRRPSKVYSRLTYSPTLLPCSRFHKLTILSYPSIMRREKPSQQGESGFDVLVTQIPHARASFPGLYLIVLARRYLIGLGRPGSVPCTIEMGKKSVGIHVLRNCQGSRLLWSQATVSAEILCQ